MRFEVLQSCFLHAIAREPARQRNSGRAVAARPPDVYHGPKRNQPINFKLS